MSVVEKFSFLGCSGAAAGPFSGSDFDGYGWYCSLHCAQPYNLVKIMSSNTVLFYCSDSFQAFWTLLARLSMTIQFSFRLSLISLHFPLITLLTSSTSKLEVTYDVRYRAPRTYTPEMGALQLWLVSSSTGYP